MASPQPFTVVRAEHGRSQGARSESITDLARRYFGEAERDPVKATDLMQQAVLKDLERWKAWLKPVVRTACYATIGALVRSNRALSWAPPAERLVATQTPHSYRAMLVAEDNLLMFPLPGGKPLGKATRVEILEAAGKFDKQAVDMAWKARWLRLVAPAVPEGTAAGKVLTEERLRKMQEDARGA